MKKLIACALLALVSLTCTVPLYSGTHMTREERDAQNRAKKQEKAARKYWKAQEKAQKKALRESQKQTEKQNKELKKHPFQY